MLNKMVNVVDISSEKQLATWVTILVGFFMYLRKSNLVPIKRQYDHLHQLSRADIRYHDDVLAAEIKWSKTNQYGEDRLRVPIFRYDDSPICPVAWILYMVNRIPAQGYHNLFSFHDTHGDLVPVTYRDLTVQLRYWLEEIGIADTHRYSSHSLRRGGTTHAFNSRVPEHTIQQLGSWASAAYKKYIDITLKNRLKAWYLIALQ